MTVRVRVVVLIGVSALAAAALLGWRLRRGEASPIPTAVVERGAVALTVRTRGEVRASRTIALIAPPADGALKIVEIRPTGSHVEAGDIVCVFDPSEVQKRVEEAQGARLQTAQDLVRAEADVAIQEGQDDLERLGLDLAVRRAELDMKRNELVSPVEARNNEQMLDDTRRRREAVLRDIELRKSGRTTTLAAARERVRQAEQALADMRKVLDTLKVRATGAGLVVVPENADAAGAYRVPGTAVLPYRSGDVVTAGRTVAEIMDLREMEVLAHVAEGDAANLATGAVAQIAVDAAPKDAIESTVKEIASLASLTPWGLRRLDVTFSLGHAKTPARPGETASITVTGPTLTGVRHVPRQAVMAKDGRLLVYVRQGRRFEARPVTVVRQTETQAIVEDLAEGTIVALADPEAAAPGAHR